MIKHVVAWNPNGRLRKAEQVATDRGARDLHDRHPPQPAAANVAGTRAPGRGAVGQEA
jgi:hypothetical protein